MKYASRIFIELFKCKSNMSDILKSASKASLPSPESSPTSSTPEFPSNAYRSILRNIPTQVSLITLSTPPIAATINSFTSLTLNPPLIQVTVLANGITSKLIKQEKRFNINFLASSQSELAKLHASSHDFKQSGTVEGIASVAGCCSVVTCEMVESRVLYEKELFIARVVGIEGNGGRPLVYHNGEYLP